MKKIKFDALGSLLLDIWIFKNTTFLAVSLKILKKNTGTEMHTLMGKEYRLVWQSEHRKG